MHRCGIGRWLEGMSCSCVSWTAFILFILGLFVFHSCITSNTHSIYIITVEKNSEETDQASSCEVAAGVLHRDLTLGIRARFFARFGDGTKATVKYPSREAPD